MAIIHSDYCKFLAFLFPSIALVRLLLCSCDISICCKALQWGHILLVVTWASNIVARMYSGWSFGTQKRWEHNKTYEQYTSGHGITVRQMIESYSSGHGKKSSMITANRMKMRTYTWITCYLEICNPLGQLWKMFGFVTSWYYIELYRVDKKNRNISTLYWHFNQHLKISLWYMEHEM